MKTFLDDDFLLLSEPAKILYHQFAKDMPIYDYHSHLSPKQIALDTKFENLTDIWLKGDHYKWRAMRTFGIDETLITGDASDEDKFLAFAKMIPYTIGNPIYHWTHLELNRPFGINEGILCIKNAGDIWNRVNQKLKEDDFSSRGILMKMNVRVVGTTDCPTSSLKYHQILGAANDGAFKMVPSFRPDPVLKIERNGFVEYIDKLSEASNISINSYQSLKDALIQRIDFFNELGCVAADHGLEILRYHLCSSELELERIFTKALKKQSLSEDEVAQYFTAMHTFLGEQYHARGWAMQMHIGAIRNNNTRMFNQLGADAGFDSIGDRTYAYELSKLLDELDKRNVLPKTVIYCLNPRDNEMIASMIGNFQSNIPGKIQFGSGWWFNDQKDGMQRQLQQLSSLGLLSQFIGMTTDSRSFLSFTRHEYFRRILCQMVGQWIVEKEVPDDFEFLGKIIQSICYDNAHNYFNREVR
ncbi:glucuronate isomerase [Thorsellia kenyensis]|uniref:Uronate isomerase n=1 Tax=Thorsellia kenyensis TaxID=1549888 RepID=A0ABV6CC75_9GAMM